MITEMNAGQFIALLGLAFGIGGLLGYLSVVKHLLEHKKRRNYSWPLPLRINWLRFFGATHMVRDAQELESERRHLFGFEVIRVMADLAGPGPWPKSIQALEGILKTAEARYQTQLKEKK